LVSNVKYDLVFNFGDQKGDNPLFLGRARINFDLAPTFTADKPLFLEFHGNGIYEFDVNGHKIPLNDLDFNKHRINFGKHLLQPLPAVAASHHTVTIKFENSYVNNSAGLHRFVDPKDQQVYIYSHLEPYNCHRWFPCFDQPSIRAPIKLQVITPDEEWKVIGNSPKLYHKQA
jgi:aminopeptidase N